jgi:hypothetical protein
LTSLEKKRCDISMFLFLFPHIQIYKNIIIYKVWNMCAHWGFPKVNFQNK